MNSEAKQVAVETLEARIEKESTDLIDSLYQGEDVTDFEKFIKKTVWHGNPYQASTKPVQAYVGDLMSRINKIKKLEEALDSLKSAHEETTL